MRNTCETK